METAVTERGETRMAEGKDASFDELSGQVGYLTGRVDEMSNRINDLGKRVEQGFAQVDARFERLEDRFDSLQRTLLQLGGAVVVGLLGLIATQI
jgi:flagellar capping protein FliD